MKTARAKGCSSLVEHLLQRLREISSNGGQISKELFAQISNLRDICNSTGNEALTLRISNSLFNVANFYRQNENYDDAVAALEKCIELSKSRSTVDIYFVKKLEMLGVCLLAMGSKENRERALDVYYEALQNCLGSDVCEELTKLSGTASLSHIMDTYSEITTLVKEITKLEFSWTLCDSFDQISQQNVILNGLLLEIRLDVLVRLSSSSVQTILVSICLERLLALYNLILFPLRRCRVLLWYCYLRFLEPSFTVGHLTLESLVGTIPNLDKNMVNSSNDKSLECHTTIMKSQLECWLILLKSADEKLDLTSLGPEIDIWKREFIRLKEPKMASSKVQSQSKKKQVKEGLQSFSSSNNNESSFKLLDILSEVLSLHFLPSLQLAVLELLSMYQKELKFGNLLPVYLKICQLHYSLGNREIVIETINEAHKTIDIESADRFIQFQWYILNFKILGVLGQLKKSLEFYEKAKSNFNFMYETKSQKNRVSKLQKLEKLYCIALVNSNIAEIAFSRHMYSEAIQFNSRAMRLLKSIYNTAKSKNQVSIPNSNPFSSESSVDEKSKTKNSEDIVFVSREFWTSVALFLQVLYQQGIYYEHRGSHREAEYYLLQGIEASSEMNSPTNMVCCLTALASLYTSMDRFQDANEYMERAKNLSTDLLPINIHKLMIVSAQAQLRHRAEEYSLELSDLNKLLNLINLMDSEDVDGVGNIKSLSKSMENMHISPSKTVAMRSGEIRKLYNDVLCRKGLTQAIMGDIDSSEETLKGMHEPKSHFERAKYHFYKFSILLFKVDSILCTDPILSTLNDSALSIPGFRLPVDEVSQTRTLRVRRGQATKPKRNLVDESVSSIIGRMYNEIPSFLGYVRSSFPSRISRRSARIVVRCAMLKSAIDVHMGSDAQTNFKFFQAIESCRDLSFARERQGHISEINLSDKFINDQEWPCQSESKVFIENDKANDNNNAVAQSNQSFPPNTVFISLDITENKDLLMTRWDVSQKRVAVRLPLARQSSQELSEEDFTFENAMEELQDIIFQARETSHSGKNMISKADKAGWWKSREDLDKRLEILVQSVERSWFGGFRGMFGKSVKHDTKKYAKLYANILQILSNTIPVFKGDQRTASQKNSLDHRFVDLFIGLRHPDVSDEENSFGELLEDLIYFLADMFRLRGNPIELDEIDLDEIIMQLEESLRQYHNCKDEEGRPEETTHLILILDTCLHTFPWESLPCLRGKSVSRIPAVSAFHERVNQAWPVVINPKGTSILNPSGDLGNTQKMFEKPLASLKSWDLIVNRPPSSLEFEHALKEHGVVLYFGHGGGEQYIRAQQIKKLPQCAVSILMGCSSGMVHGAGDFEPHGAPYNYLIAGCPALMANLWDVTDKDIDKLTMRTLEKWGLIPHSEYKLQERISLSEALSQSRDICTLPFLNGASPVVYGVPVFLNAQD